jgi:hypothetical protein
MQQKMVLKEVVTDEILVNNSPIFASCYRKSEVFYKVVLGSNTVRTKLNLQSGKDFSFLQNLVAFYLYVRICVSLELKTFETVGLCDKV